MPPQYYEAKDKSEFKTQHAIVLSSPDTYSKKELDFQASPEPGFLTAVLSVYQDSLLSSVRLPDLCPLDHEELWIGNSLWTPWPLYLWTISLKGTKNFLTPQLPIIRLLDHLSSLIHWNLSWEDHKQIQISTCKAHFSVFILPIISAAAATDEHPYCLKLSPPLTSGVINSLDSPPLSQPLLNFYCRLLLLAIP